jgi:hypothetical protein
LEVHAERATFNRKSPEVAVTRGSYAPEELKTPWEGGRVRLPSGEMESREMESGEMENEEMEMVAMLIELLVTAVRLRVVLHSQLWQHRRLLYALFGIHRFCNIEFLAVANCNKRSHDYPRVFPAGHK